MMSALLRATMGFLVSPIIVTLLVILHGRIFNVPQMEDLILLIGSTIGYGFAFFFGIPVYVLLLKKPHLIRVRSFVYFIAGCTFTAWLLIFLFFLFQDGLLIILSTTLWGYTLIFFVASSLSVAAFYLIVFYKRGGIRW
jgi:hypothetical protein